MEKRLPGVVQVGEALTPALEEAVRGYDTLWKHWDRVRAGEPGAEEAYRRWITGADESDTPRIVRIDALD